MKVNLLKAPKDKAEKKYIKKCNPIKQKMNSTILC